MFDTNKLIEIKRLLGRGALKEIAVNAGVSYQTVYCFFKGESDNPKVAEEVIREYKKKKALKERLEGCATA